MRKKLFYMLYGKNDGISMLFIIPGFLLLIIILIVFIVAKRTVTVTHSAVDDALTSAALAAATANVNLLTEKQQIELEKNEALSLFVQSMKENLNVSNVVSTELNIDNIQFQDSNGEKRIIGDTVRLVRLEIYNVFEGKPEREALADTGNTLRPVIIPGEKATVTKSTYINGCWSAVEILVEQDYREGASVSYEDPVYGTISEATIYCEIDIPINISYFGAKGIARKSKLISVDGSELFAP